MNGDIRQHANGIVTSECLSEHTCWFHIGCHRCVPKHCECVGHYRDTYVWVCPEGRDELTKLTLAILDYATNTAPAGLSKQIMFYIDEYGLPTNKQDAVGSVTANVAIDEQPASLLNRPESDELRIERILKDRLRQVNEEITSITQNYPNWKPFADGPVEPGVEKPLGRRSRQETACVSALRGPVERAADDRIQAAIPWRAVAHAGSQTAIRARAAAAQSGIAAVAVQHAQQHADRAGNVTGSAEVEC